MPIWKMNQENWPSSETFRQWLHAQDESYDPLEELLRLERELAQFEQQHDLASEEFFRRYQAGEMGDDMVFVRWAGRYRLYTNLKRAISTSLKLIVTQPTVTPL